MTSLLLLLDQSPVPLVAGRGIVWLLIVILVVALLFYFVFGRGRRR